MCIQSIQLCVVVCAYYIFSGRKVDLDRESSDVVHEYVCMQVIITVPLVGKETSSDL